MYKLSIGAACALEWPSERFVIQVLDDSTDPVVKVRTFAGDLSPLSQPPALFCDDELRGHRPQSNPIMHPPMGWAREFVHASPVSRAFLLLRARPFATGERPLALEVRA